MKFIRTCGTFAMLMTSSIATSADIDTVIDDQAKHAFSFDMPIYNATDDGDDVLLVEKNKQVIKTLQRKTFIKQRRWEVSPHLAFVTNDPFLNRYIIGVGAGYSLTEIFAIEGMLDFSPDLGDADWKPLTKQLVNENSVSPDISKLGGFGSLCFVYSPIYGKAAVLGRNIVNFDIYGKFGMGVTQTTDDLSALDAEGEDKAESTQVQIHPTTNFGGGARMIFNQNTAARVEGRSMIYIETVQATTLEMKNNFLLQFSVSFFFPTPNQGR